MATTTTAICTEVSLRLEESQGANPFAGTPAIYTTPRHVSWTHYISNRLGRDAADSDVTVLLDGTEEQQTEYIKGILIAAIIIFCFFALWMLILLVLKCCGYKRVGFFSGQRIRRPMPPTPPVLSASLNMKNVNTVSLEKEGKLTESKKAKRILAVLEQEEQQQFQQQQQQFALQVTATADTLDEEAQQKPQQLPPAGADVRSSHSAVVMEYRENVEAWQKKVKRAEQVQRRIRIVVIFCCLAVITNAILMLVYGVGAIQTSLNQVHDGLNQTSGLATSAIQLVDQFLVAQNDAVNVTESIMYSVNGICPAVQETLCQDIFQHTDCNLTGIPFKDEIQQVIEVFDDILIPIAQTASSASSNTGTNCADIKNQARRRAASSANIVGQLAGRRAAEDDSTTTTDEAAAAAAAAAAEAADAAATNASAVDLDTLVDQVSTIDEDEATNIVDQVASTAGDLVSGTGATGTDALCNEAENQVGGNLTSEVEDTINQAQDTLNQAQDALNQVEQVLDTVKYDLFKALNGAKSELQKVVDESEEMNQQVASFDWAFDVAAAFAICLAVMSIFIIIGVILAWRNELNGSCFRWVRNLVVVPVFVLLVLMSLVFSCVFVIGSITTSDVCYQSPDSLVLHVLETNLFPELEKSSKEFGPTLVDFISFYVQGCPEQVVPLDIDEMLSSKLNYVNDVVTPLQSVLASQYFTNVCGSNSGLTSGMKVMLEIMCEVSHLVLDVRDLLNCNKGNLVYTTFAYEAVCYDATKGFVWICSTQLAIVFFSMLIMTLRVACFEIEDEEDFLKQRNWCARLCCGVSKDEGNDNDEAGRNAKEDGGETGGKTGPIKTFNSDDDANDGGESGDNVDAIKALDSKSGDEPGQEEELPEAKIY